LRLRRGACQVAGHGADYGGSQEQYRCSSSFHADVSGAIEQLFREDGLIIVKASILRNGDIWDAGGVCLDATSD
jgi:hypothetical protein